MSTFNSNNQIFHKENSYFTINKFRNSLILHIESHASHLNFNLHGNITVIIRPVFGRCVPLSRHKLYGTLFSPVFSSPPDINPVFPLFLIYNLTNASAIVEYSSAVERNFQVLLCSGQTTKNRLPVVITESMIIVNTHLKNYSYNEFCNVLLKERKSLDAISSVALECTEIEMKKKFAGHHHQNTFFVYLSTYYNFNCITEQLYK